MEIPYRVVSVVSGLLDDATSRKYLLESVYSSELGSCSNTTDYLSSDLNIRYGSKKLGAKEKQFVYLLRLVFCDIKATVSALQSTKGNQTSRYYPPSLSKLSLEWEILNEVQQILLISCWKEGYWTRGFKDSVFREQFRTTYIAKEAAYRSCLILSFILWIVKIMHENTWMRWSSGKLVLSN